MTNLAPLAAHDAVVVAAGVVPADVAHLPEGAGHQRVERWVL